ncbi:monovalent cation/H(+) antiporter subunit G [Sulfitobacter sp. M57]|uniref:monovalent cation/H(+) antiporter subunit G n=1 Tax=unclassified Sulfitobacter TaxID=196795 RepID=UPI0023E0EFE8|nr:MULTISPECIES: monovalent cation/H(+) antiporter subunit G [unclassified Sulfitobacter]MDF3415504.1 monovalent cation/H(+) antiporter subunit G [Sulfitobacter sp. KE5]MDF3422985.1 monovalent cation/H(+) antiporter subunit G [Sulfitobacter sp. KE43]MDF3434050.1 monovalent cation/H(+) antiporter subunit G [Sulfitobacter sp. KE42]MDF3459917.1 monovalent cation/H(+) antiporter subunit G [Sulfitobacter sp. S74]MDF3463589.1 monovalent cation/H(+) antiporter subunit G [Sulfitobacter sp. Ks18]
MSFEIIGTYLVGICLLIGTGFALVGTIGLLKFNDSMTRLHAPTKVGTIGIGALLLASMINSYLIGQGSMHELLIMAFLFVTAPISANFIAKVNIHKQSCTAPPPPLRDDTWSTLNVPEADRELAADPET